MTYNFPPSTTFARPQRRPRKATTGKPRKYAERALQVQVVQHLNKLSRRLNWHVPNGGKRNLRTAVRFKAEGVRRGVPDLHFVLPPHGRLACLELKAEKGRLSYEQIVFRDRLLADGGLFETANNLDEALGILARWGVLPSEVGK